MCTATCVYQNGINVPFHGSAPSLSCSAPADGLLHHAKNHTGYISPIFAGKDEQCALVEQEVEKKARIYRVIVDDIHMIFVQGFIPRELVAGEVTWFYRNLGIDDTYFQNQSAEVISDHIIALFGAKVMAYTKHDPNNLVIELEKISEEGNGATFINTSTPDFEGIGSSCEAKYV